MDWFVRHHELFADISLGSCSSFIRGKLDLTNDQTTSVPEHRERDEEVEKQSCITFLKSVQLRSWIYLLLLNFLIRVVGIIGNVPFYFQINTTRLSS